MAIQRLCISARLLLAVNELRLAPRIKRLVYGQYQRDIYYLYIKYTAPQLAQLNFHLLAGSD